MCGRRFARSMAVLGASFAWGVALHSAQEADAQGVSDDQWLSYHRDATNSLSTPVVIHRGNVYSAWSGSLLESLPGGAVRSRARIAADAAIGPALSPKGNPQHVPGSTRILCMLQHYVCEFLG